MPNRAASAAGLARARFTSSTSNCSTSLGGTAANRRRGSRGCTVGRTFEIAFGTARCDTTRGPVGSDDAHSLGGEFAAVLPRTSAGASPFAEEFPSSAKGEAPPRRRRRNTLPVQRRLAPPAPCHAAWDRETTPA